MKRNFRNVWGELAFGQICSYRLVTAMALKGLAIYGPHGPKVLGDGRLTRNNEPLNPLEFHGKRRGSESPPQPQSSQRLACAKT